MRSINPHCPVFVYHIYCLVIEKYKYKSSCICLSYILLVIVKYKYKSSCICLSYKLLVFEKYKYKSSCICLSGGAVIWQGLWRPAGHPHLRANPLKMIRLKHQQKETFIFKGKSTFKLNFEYGSQKKETLRLYDVSSQDDSQIIKNTPKR